MLDGKPHAGGGVGNNSNSKGTYKSEGWVQIGVALLYWEKLKKS